ncbi:hypothetical protein ACFCVQ_18680 [Bacillus thuringiensis]|uniref:hypothetical protein n=1 Tax=Bacillus cereus group TaxID=86661 RepID=UPI00039C8D3E|nr:hypothetical protein [Bacillus cereus]HDR4537198.1 hypothetical protein [Bacillus cereus]
MATVPLIVEHRIYTAEISHCHNTKTLGTFVLIGEDVMFDENGDLNRGNRVGTN